MWQCLYSKQSNTMLSFPTEKKAVTTLHGIEDLDIAPLNFGFFGISEVDFFFW